MVMCPIHDTVTGQCTTVNTIFIAESWILWGKKTQQFYFGGEKMRNVRGQQGEPSKVKISGNKKSAQENKQQNLWWAYKTFFSIKCVTRKFHFVVVQNNIKEMCQNVCCTCKVFLVANKTIIFLQFLLSSPFSIAWFYFLFEWIIGILMRASLLALAKSIYWKCV